MYNPPDSQTLVNSAAKGTNVGQTQTPSVIPGFRSTGEAGPNSADNLSSIPKSASRVSAASKVNMQDKGKIYVLFGVTAGEDLHLAQIEVQDSKDDQFFEQLRERYNELRGFFRKWFGIWQYSHSEFVKVRDRRND
jgi:hypothetical protein